MTSNTLIGKVNVSTQMPVAEAMALRRAAYGKGMTQSEFIRRAIADAVEEVEAEQAPARPMKQGAAA